MDGLHTNTFLKFEHSAIAIACLDLALKVHGAHVPLDSNSKRSWRKAMCSNIDFSVIKSIQEQLSKVYEQDEPAWRQVLPQPNSESVRIT